MGNLQFSFNKNDKSSLESTHKFVDLNFNLKKIIFTYLQSNDQKKLYWNNKKLRALLPDSALKINMENCKKKSSYALKSKASGILELIDGTIACWTREDIKIFKITELNCELKLIKKNLFESIYFYALPIQQQNGNFIFKSSNNELVICDKEFNIIQKLKENCGVVTIYNFTYDLQPFSFAIGLSDGTIKMFSMNHETSKKYELLLTYKNHSFEVESLLYLPKLHYLLSGSSDHKINVFCLSKNLSIKCLKNHCYTVNSLIYLNESTFASASWGDFKIWSILPDTSFVCINTIFSHQNGDYGTHLNTLGNEYMISRRFNGEDFAEFKIWFWKTYDCIKTCKENSSIRELIVTKNYHIITVTKNKNVNLWKIAI